MNGESHDPAADVGYGGHGSYIAGLILAVLLTLAAFGCVMENWLTPQRAVFAIAGAAALQVAVHALFFLHLSRKSTPFWTATIFFFMILVVALLIAGSLFIMFSAQHNMMPQMPPTDGL